MKNSHSTRRVELPNKLWFSGFAMKAILLLTDPSYKGLDRTFNFSTPEEAIEMILNWDPNRILQWISLYDFETVEDGVSAPWWIWHPRHVPHVKKFSFKGSSVHSPSR